MQVTCDACDVTYDDLYRRTYCPHPYYAMHTCVVLSTGESRICTSVEELTVFLRETPPPSA